MIYRTCNCGKSERWDSGFSPWPCEGCDECGSQYGHPDDTSIPVREPHVLVARFSPATGEPDRPRCKRCMARVGTPEDSLKLLAGADNERGSREAKSSV